MLRFYSTSLFNKRPDPPPPPHDSYSKMAKTSEIIQFTRFVASLTKVCVLHLVQCQVESKDRVKMTTQWPGERGLLIHAPPLTVTQKY